MSGKEQQHQIDFDWELAQAVLGKVTTEAARVYVRLPAGSLDEDQTLTGLLAGPFCESSRTLPAQLRLTYLGADPQPLAMALAPDPSFWSPELPVRYRLQLRIEQRGELLATHQRWIGLRRFGVSGRSLVSDSRRMVVRAVAADSTDERDPSRWQELMLHRCTTDPDDQALEDAARQGVALLPRLTHGPDQLCASLLRVSQCAAASIAWLSADASAVPRDELRLAAGNLLLAAAVPLGARQLPVWADIGVLELGEESVPAAASQFAESLLTGPRLIRRPLKPAAPLELEACRRACEQLQRDVTPLGDFAGYLV